MRRILGPLLLGLGTFLIVAALLMRFYAYPALAVAPIDQNSVTKLSAPGATYFDLATLSEQTSDLSVESRTVGDVKASEAAGDGVRVWAGTTSIRTSDGTILSRSAERAAFDGNTALAINCCDGFKETTDGERVPVKRSGLVYKFPFGTEKKTYPFWDATLGAPVETKYVKETEVSGLAVYEFQFELPQTQVDTREVPASVLGEDGDGNLTADVMYANTKTFWVEPVTGAIIDREDHQVSTLAYDGTDRVTTTEANLSYTDETVAANVEDQSSNASLLSKVRGLFPILAGLLGLLLVALGVLLSRRPARAGRPDEE